MPRKADIKASLCGIARALHNSMGTGSEERLPEKLVALSERLTKSSHQDDPRMEPAIGRVQMPQKLAKSAAELESMIMAELREHPEYVPAVACRQFVSGIVEKPPEEAHSEEAAGYSLRSNSRRSLSVISTSIASQGSLSWVPAAVEVMSKEIGWDTVLVRLPSEP
jgi:hypothetical protein